MAQSSLFFHPLLTAKIFLLGLPLDPEFRYLPSFFPPEFELLTQRNASCGGPFFCFLRTLRLSFRFHGYPLLLLQGEAHAYLLYPLFFHLIDESPIRSNNFYECAGRPCERKQSGNADDGAHEPPMFSDVHPAHAKGGVAIGAEVDCIGGANDQTNAIQGKSPDKDLRNMQVEHQEDRPSELNCGGKEPWLS